jgi:hypothetical protein
MIIRREKGRKMNECGKKRDEEMTDRRFRQ